MHGVDRGPEPNGLGKIRACYTPRWVQYYTKGVGRKPTDSHWRSFHDDLERVFGGLCAYCEEITNGEVDHFRPKSKFPDLVYCWSNWLFACHDCNQAKSSSWPAGGYVDPCAMSKSDRPECYFAFDVQAGVILANPSLSPRLRQKAQRTIHDLRLNDFHHLKNRVKWLELFSAAMPDAPNSLTTETTEILVHFASREMRLSSFVRTWLCERGFPLEDPGEE